MRCPHCDAESWPARFCSECGARLETACAICATPIPPFSNSCPECGARVGGAAPTEGQSTFPEGAGEVGAPVQSWPRALRGERKQVTVLFADMKGSMELLANRDPEEARTLLDPVLSHMMDAVHRYGGTVNQVMGDGIMALFGAPAAQEEHATRACWAAVAIQERIARYGAELQSRLGIPVLVRIGINSGEVVVRPLATDLHIDYSAVGETTHLAARLQEMATPGSIRVSASTFRLAEAFIHVRSLGFQRIRGLKDRVHVYELVGTRPVRRFEAATLRGLTRFVGRQGELDALERALERVQAGCGELVAVVGEPGVGKSRLFDEFTHGRPATDCLLLEGGATAYGGGGPYLPVLDILKRCVGIKDEDSVPTVREKLTSRLTTLDRSLADAGPPLLAMVGAIAEDSPFLAQDAARRRELTHEALTRFFLALTSIQPVILILEDLQWIDADSQAFLDHLVKSLPAARLLLLLNHRPEYRHDWSGATSAMLIRLEALPSESVSAFLDALLGTDAGLEEVKRLIVDRGAGNPFFIEQIVATLTDSGALAGSSGAYRVTRPITNVDVPPTVQAVLGARIDRLPPIEKDLLERASVVGNDVPLALLQAIADLPGDVLRSSLRHLERTELLYERSISGDAVHTFKHALTHDVVYRSLLHERAVGLHAQVVEAMERLHGDRAAQRADALAYHAVRGEIWDKAVDYLRQAGGHAFAKGSVEESLQRYEQALDLIERLPRDTESLRRTIDLRLDLHVPLIVLGQLSRLVQLHADSEQLARELNDRRRLGRVLYRISQYSNMFGEYAKGIRYAEQALQLAGEVDDTEVRVLATYALGLNHCLLGAFNDAIDFFTRIVEGPDAEPAMRVLAATAPAHILGCTWLAFAATQIGRLDLALDASARAVRLADTFDHPQAQAIAYTLRVIALVYGGDLQEAIELSERAVRLCNARGLRVWRPGAQCALGWTLTCAGRPHEGLPHLEQGVTAMRMVGVKSHLPLVHSWWAEALLLTGDPDRAEDIAAHAVDLAIAGSERGSELQARYVIAAIAETRGSADAKSRYDDVRAAAEKLGMLPLVARCHLSLARAYRREGHVAAAQAQKDAAMRLFRATGMLRCPDEPDV